MPRYFFDRFDSGLTFRDETGVEIATDEGAIARADEILRRVGLFETPVSSSRRFAIDVRDEAGVVIHHAELRADLDPQKPATAGGPP